MYTQLLAIIGPIVLIAGIGFFWARNVSGFRSDFVRELVFYLGGPCLVISSLTGSELSAASLLAMGRNAVIIAALCAMIFALLIRLQGRDLRVLLPPMVFSNSGNMGLPLALFAFGEAALPAAMVLFLVENTLHFTVGNAMLTGHVNPLKLIRMPMLLATLAGLLVAMLEIQVPGPVDEAIDLLGQVAIPLMLFALGVRMTAVDLSDWRIGLAGALLCPLTGLAMAWPAAAFFDLPEMQLAQLIVFAALPPAVLKSSPRAAGSALRLREPRGSPRPGS